MAGDQVCGNIIGNPGDDETAAEREGDGVLPFTGTAVGALVLIGVGLLGVGWTAIRRAR